MVEHFIQLRNYLPRPLVAGVALILIVIANLVATVIVTIPPLRYLAVSIMKRRNADGRQDPEIILRSIPGIQTMRTMWHTLYLRIYDDIKTGQPAPNVSVVSLDGKEHKLLDFMKPGRPLVLKFGSCS